MRRRPKPTGCAKFLLIILIVAPAAFIGSSVYKGESPYDNFMQLIGKDVSEKQVLNTPDKSISSPLECQEKIKELEATILRLQNENEALKRVNNN
jgi:cell division protein FtsL